jgi:hypothetical protein
MEKDLPKKFGETRFQSGFDRLCRQGDLLRDLDRDLSDVSRQMLVRSIEGFMHGHLS